MCRDMIREIMKYLLRTLAEAYKMFSLESSIHGFRYTILVKTKLEKSIWAIILLLSFLAAGQLAILFYEKHQSATMNMLVISAQYATSMVELPALTLCHGGIAMMHKTIPYLSQKQMYIPQGLTSADFENFIKYLREAIYPKNYFPDELDKLQEILSANQLSLTELFENIQPNCSEFLLMCQLEGQTVPCSRLIEPIVTNYGICCTFNYEYARARSHRSTKLLRLRHSTRVGWNFVVSFLMKSYPSSDRVASLMYGDGTKVIMHERNAYPSNADVEFLAAAGHETIAQLNAVRITSRPDILDAFARARRCVLNLRQNHSYNSKNCHRKCHDNVIWKLCGCLPLSAVSAQRSGRACDLTHVPCLARAALRIYSVTKQDLQCVCLPNCEETKYQVALATVPLDAVRYSSDPFYKKVLEYENVTALHLTFAGQRAILLHRELVLSNINLLSSLGGTFSLFLGCSIISIIEIIYFFCIFPISRLRNKKALREDTIEVC